MKDTSSDEDYALSCDVRIQGPKNSELVNINVRRGERIFVLGGNGSGKTAMLHRLSRVSNAKIIDVVAQRNVGFYSGEITLTRSRWESQRIAHRNSGSHERWRYVQEEAYHQQQVYGPLFELSDEEAIRSQKVTAAVDGNLDLSTFKSEKSAIMKLNQLLGSIGMPISIILNGIRSLEARRDNGAPFDIAALSDGQRSVLVLAATVLTAEQGTVFLIDEPERHLSRAISAPLLRELFAERSDCSFVIATHDIDLALDHPNSRAFIMREFDPVTRIRQGTREFHDRHIWSIDFIDEVKDIPEQVRFAVLGGRKRVLFVEGEQSSIDLPLYRALIPHVTIIPRGTAGDVIGATKSLPDQIPHWLDVLGLIDRDERDEETIDRLLKDRVHVLALNSVEGIYLHPSVISALAIRRAGDFDADGQQWAVEAMSKMREAFRAERDRVCAQAIEIKIREEAKLSLPDWKAILKGAVREITVTTAGKLGSEQETFDQLINESDFTKILRRYKAKKTGAMELVAASLRFRSHGDYKQYVVSLLRKSRSLRAEILDLMPTLSKQWGLSEEGQ